MKVLVSKWADKDGANKLDANGLIRLNDNKPEFGSLMLVTPNVISIENGFMNKRNKVAFITGRVDDLKEVIKAYGLKEGSDYSVKFGAHKIVTIEKLESQVPENQGFREKVNPQTGEVLTKNGEDIYWKTELVVENEYAMDEKIVHDKTPVTATVDESIKEFQGEAGKK